MYVLMIADWIDIGNFQHGEDTTDLLSDLQRVGLLDKWISTLREIDWHMER